MTPDQLDDAGWTAAQWTELNALACTVVADKSQVRSMIPKGPDMPGVYTVAVPMLEGLVVAVPPVYVTTYGGKPVIRMRARFRIRAEQVADFDLVKSMVHSMASRLAAASDDVLVNGGEATGRYGKHDTVFAYGLAADTVGLRRAAHHADPPLEALVAAAHALRTAAPRFFGPYHAVLSPTFWNALAVTHSGTNRDGLVLAARILGTESRGLAMAPQVGAATASEAVVFEPSPFALDLVTVHPARIAYVGTHDGDLDLRVEEAFFLRIKISEACVTVTGK